MGTVVPLRAPRDDAALVRGVMAGDRAACVALFDSYGPMVERVLRRILGHERHVELADLINEVFANAMEALPRLRDSEALPAWMQAVAVNTAYRHMRARRARRWLFFLDQEEIPETPVDDVDPELRDAVRRTYRVLDELPARERVAFTLKYIEGMELPHIAAACECSVSTIKRLLQKAERRFMRIAENDSVLREWLEQGAHWTR